MVSVGDKVIVFSPGSDFAHAVELTTPEVGDTVTLYQLADNTQIAVPSLTFDLDNYVFVTPSFQFAGFDFNLDFDFKLLLLALEKFRPGEYYYGDSWDWTDGWEMTFAQWGSTMWSGGVYEGVYDMSCPAGFTSGKLWLKNGQLCYRCGAYVSMKKTFTGPASGLSIHCACSDMYHWYIYLNGVLVANHTAGDTCRQKIYMFPDTLRDFEIELKFQGGTFSESSSQTATAWVSALYFYE